MRKYKDDDNADERDNTPFLGAVFAHHLIRVAVGVAEPDQELQAEEVEHERHVKHEMPPDINGSIGDSKKSRSQIEEKGDADKYSRSHKDVREYSAER